MTFRNLAKLYLADCKPRHKASAYSFESYHIYEEATTHFFDVRQPLFAWHRSRRRHVLCWMIWVQDG